MSQESTIRRGVRNARYAAIPNHVFEDSRLSMEARWLLSYLLSKPDNWTVVIGDIIKKGNCGRDKARKMIAELVEHGYAEREQQRADGKFGSSVLVIFDEPRDAQSSENAGGSESVAFLPQTDLPATALPSPVLPSPVKSALSNNSGLENTDCQNPREGGREARQEGARADGDEPEESPAAIERAFWRLVKNWPDFDGMPKEPAKAPWFALSRDERREALERMAEWKAALKRQRKSYVPAPSTYLREKLWQDIPAAPAKPEGPKLAASYGKLWMSEALADLLRKPYGQVAGLTAFERTMVETGRATAEGLMREKIRKAGWPLANTMMERARERKGYPCRAELLPLAEGFHQAQRTGELFAAWKREFHRRGWPFPGETPEWVYFPPVAEGWEGDPDGAVRTAIDDFAERLREVRGDDDAA
ncbi:MAG: helix-turn-helix domain-containing protein [Shinella sp.]|nr:helix-turn-helix domain-containing protein [Shinella sp.]